MDIQKTIDELVKKLTSDKELLASFKKEPIATVERLIGIDLPDDIIEKLVSGIKAKLGLDKLTDTLSGLFGR